MLMRTWKNDLRNVSLLIATGAICLGAIANCTGTMSSSLAPGSTGGREVAPACDPDGVAPCWDDTFICADDEAGNKRCEGQNPATPDDGAWECYEEGTTLVCRGDHMPPDDGFWTCIETGGVVVCRSHAYVPGDGADDTWTCWYEGEFRVCESGGGSSEPGGDVPGEDGGEDGGEGGGEGGGGGGNNNPWDDWFPDDNGDGIPDAFEDMAGDFFQDLFDDFFNGGGDREGGDSGSGDCECVPGAWRYCDTPTYCRWGVQYCDADGLDWGACVEGGIPGACNDEAWYSPEAEACCIDAGLCCQDMWDLDYDGDTWESLGSCADIVCE
jgi:hypothetical protein